MTTGAEALIESLKRENVTEIFGYAGATICPAADALKHSDIHYTLVRTEQNAGHMASGYSRISGKVGVCMVTSGPGATNLITGIATAYMDSIPMVAITGQVESYLLGRDIFQEVDITGITMPITKCNFMVHSAAEMADIVREAFAVARGVHGVGGVVLVDAAQSAPHIPIDVQKAKFEPVYPETVDIRGYKPSVKGNIKQVQRAAEAIRHAKKPVLCLGGGVISAGAQKEALAFAEKSQIPIVSTMMGLGIVPTEHPLYVGMIGSFGTPTANRTLTHSDLLILVGARVANRAILQPSEIGRRMKTIHIDVDPAEIGKNVDSEIFKLELLLNQAGLAVGDRAVEKQAHAVAERTGGAPAAAIELPDGTVVTGKNGPLLGAASSALLNALKKLAGIDHEIDLVSARAIEPIQTLKTNYLGSRNPRLHTDEILIALSSSAAENETAAVALQQLSKLKGCDMHSTVILSSVDTDTIKRLGMYLTCEPAYEQEDRKYHKK